MNENLINSAKVDSLPTLQPDYLFKPVGWNSAPGASIFKTGTAGVGPFLNAVDDLLPQENAQDALSGGSWWASGYFVVNEEIFGCIYNPLLIKTPQGAVVVENISLTNITTGALYSSSNTYPIPQATVNVDKKQINIVTPTGSLQGDFDDLHATGIMEGAGFDVHMKAASPVIFNGGTGNYPLGSINFRQYSVPILATVGTLTIDGKAQQVQGNSWFDRQWGSMPSWDGSMLSEAMPKWTWFGINLSNGEALSVWLADDPAIGKKRAFATILHGDGSQTVAAASVKPDKNYAWISSASGNTYYLKWDIEIPQLDTLLSVTSACKEQEFSMQSMGAGYEGICGVTGTFQGKSVTGVTRLELHGGS